MARKSGRPRLEGSAASLEKRKIYIALRDAAAQKHGLLRIIDESGEDYLYPKKSFRPIALPHAVETSRAGRLGLQPHTSPDAYAAELLPRDRGGAINASAGMPHSRCSRQAILIVRGRFLVRMSHARWREPSRRRKGSSA